MNLKKRINEDIKKAMKEKNELLLLVLRSINSAIHNKEIDKKQELKDEDIIEILMIEAKKRKDSIEQFTKGNRVDLVEKEKKELEIIKNYLPEQMDETKIKEEVEKAIKESGAVSLQDTGKIMSVLMPRLKGKAEGAVVSKIVSELLKNA